MYRYRERDGDCSSDSDDEVMKLNKVHRDSPVSSTVMDTDSKPETPTVNQNKKRKVNNIWSSVAQEQTINEDMCKFNMNRLPDSVDCDRGCESYDFMRKYDDTRSEPETDEEINLDYGVSDIENEFEESSKEKQQTKKSVSTNKVPIVERLEDAKKFGKELGKKLGEKRVDLLEKIVQVLGRKKAFDLFHMTEDIEDSGGMLTINGTRRRTPGGVFFYQLRKDSNVSKKVKDWIFSEDREKFVAFRKAQRKLMRRNTHKKLNKKPVPDKMDLEDPESRPCITDLEDPESRPCMTENNTELSEKKEATVVEAKPNEQTSDVELEEGEIE